MFIRKIRLIRWNCNVNRRYICSASIEMCAIENWKHLWTKSIDPCIELHLWITINILLRSIHFIKKHLYIIFRSIAIIFTRRQCKKEDKFLVSKEKNRPVLQSFDIVYYERPRQFSCEFYFGKRSEQKISQYFFSNMNFFSYLWKKYCRRKLPKILIFQSLAENLGATRNVRNKIFLALISRTTGETRVWNEELEIEFINAIIF